MDLERLTAPPGSHSALTDCETKSQVPASYMDKDVGTLPTPRAKPPSPGAPPPPHLKVSSLSYRLWGLLEGGGVGMHLRLKTRNGIARV